LEHVVERHKKSLKYGNTSVDFWIYYLVVDFKRKLSLLVFLKFLAWTVGFNAEENIVYFEFKFGWYWRFEFSLKYVYNMYTRNMLKI